MIVRNLLKITTSAFLASTLLASAPALAVDLLVDPEATEGEVTQVEYGTGWYIRGDLGVGWSDNGVDTGIRGYDDNPAFQAPSSFSVGAGTRINPMFRTDVTFERFGEIESQSKNRVPCGGLTTGICADIADANVTANGLMLNGYVDIPLTETFQPFIGGGLGIASLTWNNLNVLTACDGAVAADCAGAGVGTHVIGAPLVTAENAYRIMGNLQVGAGIRINDKMTVDLGYRFTAIEGDAFNYDAQPIQTRGSLDTGALINHEFRVGFRYEIW